MELRHLRYFAAVAETLHFGQAASTLRVAQPALSQAIRQLEKELGTPLLTRTTRHVALTAAGAFLQEEAERILAAVESAEQGVRRIGEGHQGLVRIGFTGSAGVSLMPRVARTVSAEVPGAALEVHPDLLTGDQVAGLSAGTLDIAFLRPPVTDDALEVHPVVAEPLAVALPADHPLVEAPRIRLADLREEPFVAFSASDSAVNHVVARVCREAGFTPRVEHRAPTMAVLLPYVAAGLGVALVPASVRSSPLEGVALRDLDDAGSIDLAVAWRREGASPTVGLVLHTLRAAGLLPADTPLPAGPETRVTEPPTRATPTPSTPSEARA